MNNLFNVAMIIALVCLICTLYCLVTDAWRAGKEDADDGLFITHEELGKMREDWIEYGKKLGRKENDNSPCKPRK